MISSILKIQKRNREVVDFEPEKIYQAVVKATADVYVVDDVFRDKIAELTHKVVLDLQELGIEIVPIYVIQAAVEKRLLDYALFEVAESYIGYRLRRDIERYGYGDVVNVRLRIDPV